MGRILIEQDGKYIPSTDEDIAGLSEPLGRGSSSLKKKVVRVGTRDGLPVYKLVPIDEPTPAPTARPTPEAPRPTPGPMSKAPDALDPYRSQTPIPEFNLGITGAPLPTARSQGARGATDPVAKAKAQAAAAKAKQKSAVRAPLAPKKELQGPMNPSTDAKRRWEERYLRADAPKPEPLDLSLPPPPPEAQKPDPLEKFKGQSLANVPFPGDTGPAGAGDGSKPPVSSRESDLPPDDFSKPERTYDDLTDAGRAELGNDPAPEPDAPTEPVDGVTPVGPDGDLEGKLDEAGGGMFGKREFNEGEQPQGASVGPTEAPKKDWTNLYGGGTPGDGQAMERTDRKNESTQTSGVKNKGLLLQAEGELYYAKSAQEKSLQEMQDYIEAQRGTDETQRGKFAQDRQNLIAKYTQGLDDTAKARFIDTLVKNVGKIVAGGVGLHKGIDVAANYKYEGADTEGMRKDVEGAYKAGVEDLEAREKDRKGVADKEFERRQAILKAQGDVAQGHHQRVVDLLGLQKEVTNYGWSSDVMSWPPARLLKEAEDMQMKANELARQGRNDEANIELRKAELINRILIANINAKAAVDTAKAGKATVKNEQEGTKEQENEVEEKTNPEDVRIGRIAVSEANNVLKWLNAGNSKDYVDAIKAGNVKTALEILRGRLVREGSLAEQGKQADRSKRIVEAVSILDQMTPHITSTDQIQDIVGTFNTLVADPNTGLGATLSGTRKRASSKEGEKKSSSVSVTGSTGAVIPKSTTPGKLTDAEIAGYQDVLKRSTDPKHRAAAEKKLREAGLL